MSLPIQIVNGVHWDDIHGFTPVGANFISGSKDGALKEWSDKGELVEVIKDIAKGEGDVLDYTKWITALCTVNDKSWLSGSRDGTITLWQKGSGRKTISLRQDNRPSCKPRNEDRVTFLAADALSESTRVIFVGQARSFSLIHLERGKLRTVTLSGNDWLYGMLSVNAGQKLAIVGTALHLLNKNRGWKTESILYNDIRIFDAERGYRPYISCLVKNSEEGRKFSFGVFDGAVKTIDLERQTPIGNIKAHGGRVWSVLSPKEHQLLSSGDDGFVRLWDLRQGGPAAITFRRDVGRVSCLHIFSDKTFVAGSCPNRPSKEAPSARFTFWDMRMASQKRDDD